MSNEPLTPSGRPYIGGQAVIEGVMMRSPHALSIAVRKPNGTFAILEEPMKARTGAGKVPFLRGMIALVESMRLGYRALAFSAEQQEVVATPVAGTLTTFLHTQVALLSVLLQGSDGEVATTSKPAATKSSTNAAMALSMAFAIALFFALPQLLAAITANVFGWTLPVQDARFHALTGFFKLFVFTAYLTGISQIAEIRRVFQYHGAEHKTIFTYEAGQSLTTQNVMRWTTLHPRCGTTFLITVIIISVIMGVVVTPLVLPNIAGASAQFATLLLRIAMLPVIAAISFELQRVTARYCTTGPLRVLLWPGFLFQKITTREPEVAQVEVAILAMEAARQREEVAARHTEAETTRMFASFEAGMAQLATSAT